MWSEQAYTGARVACHCATVANVRCLIASGCYAEAGARRQDGAPSDNRLAALQQAIQENTAAASQQGLTCQ